MSMLQFLETVADIHAGHQLTAYSEITLIYYS